MANQDNRETFTVVPATASSRARDREEPQGASFWAKTILIWLLQVVGASSAVVFGMFSTLAWQKSEIAKNQADAANLLSMVALCTQLDGADERYQALCDSVKVAAQNRLQNLAVSMFGTLSGTGQSSTTSPSSTTIPSTSTPLPSNPDLSSRSSSSTSSLTLTPPSSSPTTTFMTSRTTPTDWTLSVGPLPTGPPGDGAKPEGGLIVSASDKIALAVGIVTIVISLLSLIWIVPQIMAHNRRKKEVSRE